MSKQNRLKTILDFILKQEEAAARELSIWLQKQRNAQQQIAQLQQYAKEYTDENPAAPTVDIPQLQNRQHFLVKLNSAIEQQRTQLSEVEKSVETHSKTWQKTKSQREGLEKIMRNYQSQAGMKEERQLQTDLDAYAGRRS